MFNTKILRTPNFFLYSILIFFIISKILFLLYENNVWWDAAVYIGMGKYIFSLGDAGFWEASRPIVWPIILGFLWKINHFSWKNIISIIFFRSFNLNILNCETNI